MASTAIDLLGQTVLVTLNSPIQTEAGEFSAVWGTYDRVVIEYLDTAVDDSVYAVSVGDVRKVIFEPDQIKAVILLDTPPESGAYIADDTLPATSASEFARIAAMLLPVSDGVYPSVTYDVGTTTLTVAGQNFVIPAYRMQIADPNGTDLQYLADVCEDTAVQAAYNAVTELVSAGMTTSDTAFVIGMRLGIFLGAYDPAINAVVPIVTKIYTHLL